MLSQKSKLRQNILWLDCFGALLAGSFVVVASPWLSTLYAMPVPFIVALGIVNLLYGSYSYTVARGARSRLRLNILICGNAAWLPICLLAAFLLSDQASVFGLAHLIFEGLYVAWLAMIEWSERDDLIATTTIAG